MIDIVNHDSLLDDPLERAEWASEQVEAEDEWDEDLQDDDDN